MKFIKVCAIKISFILMLAGCGGGGGGGGGATNDVSSTSTLTSTNNALSINRSTVSVSRIILNPSVSTSIEYQKFDISKPMISAVVEGQPVPSIYVNAILVGDLKILRERDYIYLKIENEGSLFDKSGQIIESNLNSFGWSRTNFIFNDRSGEVEIVLAGVDKYLNPGKYAGVVGLTLCLDKNCTQQIGGPPIQFSYDIEILKALTISNEVLEVKSKFGDPTIRDLNFEVTVPKSNASVIGGLGGSDFFVDAAGYPLAPTSQSTPFTYRTSRIDDKKYSVNIRVFPAPPGVYEHSVEVTYKDSDLLRSSFVYKKLVKIKYTIDDNPGIDVVFYPGEVRSVARRSDNKNISVQRPFVARSEVKNFLPPLYDSDIEYVSSTPGSVGNPMANSWLRDYFYGVFSACQNTINGNICLLNGVYVARARYSYTINGVRRSAYLPIVLEVVD